MVGGGAGRKIRRDADSAGAERGRQLAIFARSREGSGSDGWSALGLGWRFRLAEAFCWSGGQVARGEVCMKKLGVGVLGVGEMGKRHAENLRRLVPEARLAAIADASVDLARA